MAYRNKKTILTGLLFVSCFAFPRAAHLFAQDWAKPMIRFQQRVDLRELGYPMVNEVPVNSSAITSLLVAADGKIYGGTCGEEAYLLVFDPYKNKVKHLGKIKGQEAIHHSLVQDKDGFIYLGTAKNPFVEIPLSKKGVDEAENIDIILLRDIRKAYQAHPEGHLYRYDPAESGKKNKLPDMECDLEDLGAPLAGNSIYALTINPAGDEIYGLTYPDGHFFIYDIAGGTFRDLGEIDEKAVFHGPERYWRSLPRALVCDDSGRVYTSGTYGQIVYYDPGTGKIVKTGLKVPMDRYPTQFFSDYAVVECFARAGDGIIYGGSSDGYLFRLDTEKMELVSLGKLQSERRMRAITVGCNGKVYFMAGERSVTRPCQLFSHDPLKGGLQNLGVLIVDRSPHYYWRGYQFDCMVTGTDGTIYLGESERRSHLFLYMP